MRTRNDDGIVLPLFALVLVLLLVLVAFAVDLGATAQRRRSSQNMADAAALAAAYHLGDSDAKFATGNARTNAIAAAEAVAKKYVAENGGIAANDGAWTSCSDSKALALSSPGTPCISFSNDLTQARVRIPDESVAFQFAPVVGMSSGLVRSAAVAEVISSVGGGTRPILLRQGTLGLNCIEDGSPGQCQGASLGAGNFGVAVSPRYRAFTGGNDQDKTAVNFALGIDHMLQLTTASGVYCDEQVANSAKCTQVGGTPAGNNPATLDLAHYAVTETGNQLGPATRGLLGTVATGTFTAGSDTVLGLLFRPDNADPEVAVPSGSPATPLESFGSTWGNPSFNGVHISRFILPDMEDDVGCVGQAARSLTTKLSDSGYDPCNLSLSTYLQTSAFSSGPVFSSDIIKSPRFGVAPVTDSTLITGTSVVPIVNFYGIYLDRIYGNNNSIQSIQAFVFPFRLIQSDSGGPGAGLPYLGGPFGVRLIR